MGQAEGTCEEQEARHHKFDAGELLMAREETSHPPSDRTNRSIRTAIADVTS